MKNIIRLLAILTLAVAGPALAQDAPYQVTLKPEATSSDPRRLALRLANTYGGTLEERSGEAIIIRVSPARAQLLAADRNVQSISLRAEDRRLTTVAATAIDWNAGQSYEYDGSGNIKRIGYEYDGSGNITKTGDSFSYDVVGRLVEAHTGGVQRRYEYDAFGNRTKCTQSGDPCQSAETISASSNRLQAPVGYDARGNVTSQGGHTYVYDELNRLASDTYGAVTREYLYDARDNRIAVRTSSATGAWWRWTFRDPLTGKPLREFTSQGLEGTSNWKWERDYLWRDGLLLATVQPDAAGTGTTTYHYHLDHLGTPRRITDDNDRIVGVHDYHPFGPEVPGGTNEPSLSLMKYTGHERDALDSEPGGPSDYMMARYYSPNAGRFLSVDPSDDSDPAIPQSWNRYAYVRNNPIIAIDTNGLATFYVTTGFTRKQFHDQRVADYLAYNAINYEIDKGTATLRNFKQGMNDPDGVSIYFGHSDVGQRGGQLKFQGGYEPVGGLSTKNAVTCLAACNTADFGKQFGKLGKGQAIIGVTSNLTQGGVAGFVKAGDLSYISTQLIEGLKAGKSVGQITKALNTFFEARAKKDPKYRVHLTVTGDPSTTIK